MSTSNIISISAKNYPNAILLGNKPYDLTFQIISNSSKPEQFKFYFSMDGLSGKIPKQYDKPIMLEPSKPFMLTIPIVPEVNGSAKIVMQSNIYQETIYKELVWHVRTEVSQKRIKEALSTSFIKIKDVSKIKKKLPKFKNGKQLDLDNAAKEYERIYTSELDQLEKDEQLKDVAKRAYNSDLNFAFEILKMVQNQASIQELLGDFIYAGLERDRTLVLSKLPMIRDIKVKDVVFQNLANYFLDKDLNLAIQYGKEITNEEIRDIVLKDIISFSYLKQFDEAMQLISFLSNQELKLGLYYELIKILQKTDVPKCVALIQNLIVSCINTKKNEILGMLLIILAHITNPQYVVDLIAAHPPEIQDLEKILTRTALWEEVEEEKIRVDEVPISSVYFAFNVMAKPTPGIAKVAELGGTVSANLINGKMDSVIGIINLFSFNFPIYPTIEQCYAEINSTKGKSFYYLIIPLRNADDSTYEIVQTIIKNLFVAHANEVPHKMYLFNLDFIPYLSQPTIIVEDDPEENIVMQSIVKRVFKNEVSLIIDDGLFKEGKINHWIKSILPSNKFKLLNMVLTYDFLNNYNLFKNLMNEFVR